MLINNLPVLHVIIPLLAAGVCAMISCGRTAWVMATIATWASFGVVIMLLLSVLGIGSISYEMGGWKPPIGIEYRFDTLSVFVLLLVTFISAVMMPYARISIAHEIPKHKQHLFYAVYLLCFAGLLGILSTNDIFNVYVFLEIASLSMYTLIAMGKDRRALTAAFEYLILGTIGATFILIGIGLLYIMTGTLNISDMAERMSNVEEYRPIAAAFAFITLGVAMKIALFPLHIWLTNSYTYAPSFVSAFISATAAKVSIYLFIRLIYTLFGYDYLFSDLPVGIILIILGTAGILVGSLTAVYQSDVKRMLAFSSIAQIGYIVLGIGIVTETGLIASLVHFANHALAKSALFLAVGAVYLRVGGTRKEDFAGIAKQMPLTMAAFVLAGFSLIGIPATAGFISKWYFVKALLDKDMLPLVIILLISSLLTVVYIWQVIEVAYFKERPRNAKKVSEAPVAMLVSIWVLVIANFYFGINTSITLGLATKAVAGLL